MPTARLDDHVHPRVVLYVCDHCGREHYVFHSCRNRVCPKGHGKDTDDWLAARRQELLPVPYFRDP